jgi:hypothetical protein
MKPCDCFAVGIIAGKPQLCRVKALDLLVRSKAATYYVGLNPPSNELRKILKLFKKFKYCPKCGKKIDFEKVEKELGLLPRGFI